MKELLAKALVPRFKNGETIGVGQGSTVEAVLSSLKSRISQEKLQLFAVPVSLRSATAAEEAGMIVLSPNSTKKIDWGFDGADEVDSSLRLIKGAGGAMLGEKIVAKRAGGIVVVVTADKLVSRLGERFAVPVEVVPAAVHDVQLGLADLGASSVSVRWQGNSFSPSYTERGNMLLDAKFSIVPGDLEAKIKTITGVVESGLFFGLTREVLVASQDGVLSQRLESGRLVSEKVNFS